MTNEKFREKYMGTATRARALDAAIQRSIADADAGRTKPAKEVFDRLEENCFVVK